MPLTEGNGRTVFLQLFFCFGFFYPELTNEQVIKQINK